LCDEALAGRAGLQCLDAESGSVQWGIGTDASIKNRAVTAGKVCLAAVSVTGQLYLVDWDAGRMHWIYTAPAVAEGVVYAGAKKGYGAYDLQTGARLWYCELEKQDNWSCYASPQVCGAVLIALVPRKELVALDRGSG